MKGNDLDNKPTMRTWVMSPVVVNYETNEKVERKYLLLARRTQQVHIIPDQIALSRLWRYSERYGHRLELVFIGDDALFAMEAWDTIEREAVNPFSDWRGYEDYGQFMNSVMYRPDVVSIIGNADQLFLIGNKGTVLNALPV